MAKRNLEAKPMTRVQALEKAKKFYDDAVVLARRNFELQAQRKILIGISVVSTLTAIILGVLLYV